MGFRGLVWKRVDLENRAAHPTKNSQEYPPGKISSSEQLDSRDKFKE